MKKTLKRTCAAALAIAATAGAFGVDNQVSKNQVAAKAYADGEIDKLAEFLDLLKEQCDKADKITPDTEGDLE